LDALAGRLGTKAQSADWEMRLALSDYGLKLLAWAGTNAPRPIEPPELTAWLARQAPARPATREEALAALAAVGIT
jgi:hypothetical protein